MDDGETKGRVSDARDCRIRHLIRDVDLPVCGRTLNEGALLSTVGEIFRVARTI